HMASGLAERDVLQANLRGSVLDAAARLGATWLPGVQVTDVASKGDPSFKAKADWLADTTGLAADASGVFHPVWIDKRTGVRQVFTATVTVAVAPGPGFLAIELAKLGSYDGRENFGVTVLSFNGSTVR